MFIKDFFFVYFHLSFDSGLNMFFFVFFTTVKVHSSNGDTYFFNIVIGVLQEDALAPYLFIVCLNYVLRTSIDLMKENGFTLAKARSRRYLAQTITDMDNTDDIELYKTEINETI